MAVESDCCHPPIRMCCHGCVLCLFWRLQLLLPSAWAQVRSHRHLVVRLQVVLVVALVAEAVVAACRVVAVVSAAAAVEVEAVWTPLMRWRLG